MKYSIYSVENKTLTAWLVEKRHHAKLTQRDLAKKLGVHHSIVGKVETGERRLNVVEFVEYCLTLQADPNEVIDALSQKIQSTSSNDTPKT